VWDGVASRASGDGYGVVAGVTQEDIELFSREDDALHEIKCVCVCVCVCVRVCVWGGIGHTDKTKENRDDQDRWRL